MRYPNHLDELYTAAVHEAGHAVIGRVLGLACGQVTIIGEEGENVGHAVIANPRCSWERGDGPKRRVAENFAVALYAGAEAERFILGNDSSGDGVDCDRAAGALAWGGVRGASFVGDERFDQAERRLRARALSLVQKHAAEIKYLASVLQHRRTLDGNAVDELLLRFNLSDH